MGVLRTVALTLVGLMVPDSLVGQVPGSQVIVEVTVDSVTMVSDTAEVFFELGVDASAAEALFKFWIATPSPVLDVSTPDANWLVVRSRHGAPIMSLSILGQLAPGAHSGQVRYRAEGLPVIVDRWAIGWFPPIEITDANPHPDTPDPFDGGSEEGSFVGVEVPDDTTPVGLAARLESLRAAACGGLGWISSLAVCAKLERDLAAVATAIGGGDRGGAAEALLEFEAALDAAQAAEDADPSAYWLLRVNSEYLRRRL